MQEFRKRFSGTAGTLPGLPAWESELLWARGIDTPEKAEKFLHPRMEDLHPPERMQDMDRAVRLIRGAIAEGKRILVYGDYDVDGISAVTILLETLREERAEADFRIPCRQTEGYGLNEKAVREIAEKYGMLITVDCGIASADEVRLAKSLGLEVIVTDHHELPASLPPADAVLNPLLGDYPFRRLCGAGVALKLCQALQGDAGTERRLEIAALATVADIVPLTDENRLIVREGMRRMAETARPGLRALMKNAGITLPMRADDIAFRLAPRLNAAGRLGDAARGVRLLMTEDPEEAEALARELEENNRSRQEQERQILEEALRVFPEQVDLRRDRAVILEGEGWNTGLIGLAAGKLCERFHHPVVVLSRLGETAVGSCRSIPGVNIWQMLNLCADLFVRFGGHEQAAGLTVPADRIPELRERLNRAIRENCAEACFVPVREYDSEMPLEQVTLETAAALEALEPVGFGNPPPVFRCRSAFVQSARAVGKNRSHLKLTLLEGQAVRDGIGFGLADEGSRAGERTDVLFRPDWNEFNGRITPQMQVLAIRPAGGAGEAEPAGDPEDFFLRCLQEMSRLSANGTEHIPGRAGLRPEHLLKERLAGVDASTEALRDMYRRIRDFAPGEGGLRQLCEESGAAPEQVLFALTAFEQLGLLEWQRTPFRLRMLPVRKIDPESSPAVRYMQSLTAAGPRS